MLIEARVSCNSVFGVVLGETDEFDQPVAQDERRPDIVAHA